MKRPAADNRLARRATAAALALALSIGLCGCDIFETKLAGGGSEAGNAIVVGRLTDASGDPMEGVIVRAYREHADPVSDTSAAPCEPFQSDVEGRYRLRCDEGGVIQITGIHPERRTAFLMGGIRPLAKRTLQLPDAVLRIPGRLRVALPDSGALAGGYVYVPGTPYFQPVDAAALAAGSVVIDPVPTGTMREVRLAAPGGFPSLTLATDISVASTQTTNLPAYGDWARSRSFRLDPAAFGPLGRNLVSFPLLVRLDAGNFDFTQARADGADLRFAKADGTPLPFAIESWDAAASRAAVWVRMDTVFADGRGQTVTLFWGNSRAKVPPASRPVFDTASGFAGVWHLSEDRDSTHTPGVYRDATPGGTDGDDYITSKGKPGAIGGGLDIQGRMWVEMRFASTRMEPAQALTLSAWIKPDSLGDSSSILAELENGYSLRLMHDSTARFEFSNGTETVSVHSVKLPIKDGKWHQVAAVFDGGTATIYLDGVQSAQVPAAGLISYTGNSNRRFFIGNWSNVIPGFDNYYGGLDEVQLSHAARGPGWIALAYANQAPGAKILVWLP